MSKTAIEMARDAGATVEVGMAPVFYTHNELLKFAELVRADERKKLAAPVQEPVYLVEDDFGLFRITTKCDWRFYNVTVPGVKKTLIANTTPQAQPLMWRPMETAPSDMHPRLFLVNGFCVQGFIDAAGAMMVQSEITPHWRKMRGKPTNWMPLPRAHGITKGNT